MGYIMKSRVVRIDVDVLDVLNELGSNYSDIIRGLLASPTGSNDSVVRELISELARLDDFVAEHSNGAWTGLNLPKLD